MDALSDLGARALAFTAMLALGGLSAGCEPTYTRAPAVRHAHRAHRAQGVFRDEVDASHFQKGNIHTHTTESDGKSPPEDVISWYRDRGYNFLALSDHNRLTHPDRFRDLEKSGFTLIRGEEVTLKGGGVPVHLIAACHKRRIGGRRFPTVESALEWGVRRVRQEGGVAMINHPNYHWAFGSEAIPAGSGAAMLEIWSGHPHVFPEGDQNHPSVEAMWDDVLSAGMDIGPAGADDMHHLDASPKDSRRAGPGRGWMYVFARHADEGEICDAMHRGQFMASNGVRLTRLTVKGDTFSLQPKLKDGTVEFIGRGGQVLARQNIDPWGRQPNVYRLRGNEGYVRARVTAPNGTHAWTHAYRVD